MSSSSTINFSLRHNKAIERSIAFDVLLGARDALGEGAVYVGFGSLWFKDFQMAHRLLGIERMVSIEGDEDVLNRVEFNRPFGNIEIAPGWSTEVLPRLLEREDLASRPWIIWLDYDSSMTDDRLEELADLVGNLQPGSAILTTFCARASLYGADVASRREAVADIFGQDIVAPELSDDDFKGEGLMRTLAHCTLDYLRSQAISMGRPGGFVPGLRLLYRDSVNMVTVGGFLPEVAQAAPLRQRTAQPDWLGFEDRVLETQPLTMRETLALSRLLPAEASLTEQDVAALGFELGSDQIRLFERYYHRYPSFVEIQ